MKKAEYDNFYFKGIHLKVRRRKKPTLEKPELFDCTGKSFDVFGYFSVKTLDKNFSLIEIKRMS